MHNVSELLTPAVKQELLALSRGTLTAQIAPELKNQHQSTVQSVTSPSSPSSLSALPDSKPIESLATKPSPTTPSPACQKVLDLNLGLFVTLKIHGNLRGCIGNFAGAKNLGQLIGPLTLDSALRDYRFSPVLPNELPSIIISLSLLTPDQPIPSWSHIELGTHGIILEAQGRRSVFLPEVATEQGWNLEQTLTALARKAGLSPLAWKEPKAHFRIFWTYHFGEDP